MNPPNGLPENGLPATTPDHLLRADERAAFERDGFLRIPAALPPAVVAELRRIADSEFAAFGSEPGRSQFALLNQHGLIGRDRAYLELVDWPTTFPKVFGVLGWNIQLFHTQLVVTPPPSRTRHAAGTPGTRTTTA